MTENRRKIIAINRESGSGGAYIGARVAEELGIKCYHKELLDMAMELGDLENSKYADVFRAVDEKRPNLATFRMYEEGNLNVTKYMSASDTIFDLQKRLIQQIAENEDAVIIGRCGNWILQDEDVSMISVYIRAPLEDRIQRVMENSDLDEADAKRFIRKTDRRRSEYYYHNTKRHWSDFEHYDLVLNSASLGEDSCVALLCDSYREIL